MSNRVIKFRGYSVDKGDWVYGSLVNNLWTYSELHQLKGESVCEIIVSGEADDYEDIEDKELNVTVVPKSIGQYCGLTDKEGKEIYEGDELYYLGTNASSMTVAFKDGCFVGIGPFNTRPLIDYIKADDFQFIEIIGNIQQPPVQQEGI